MMASHLQAGRLNVNILREYYRRELVDLLDRFQGSKAVVWDDTLTGPVGLIAEYTMLKEHQVDKMFPLRAGRLPANTVQHIVFITRAKLSLMDFIAQNVMKEEDGSGHFHKEFHILFVPRKSFLCENKLKELGVYGTFSTVEDFCMEIIPFDSDLLSMEWELSFRQCHLEKDETSLFHAARALMTLQALYGIIPNICGKGDCAEVGFFMRVFDDELSFLANFQDRKKVINMMMRMRQEVAGNEPQIIPQIDNLLVIDRFVDPLTPLLTQLTYEGLIDEIFGITNTTAKFPPEKFVASGDAAGSPSTSAAVGAPPEPKKIILNSSEELFGELRDRNFHAVGPLLSKKAKLISAEFDSFFVDCVEQFGLKLPSITISERRKLSFTEQFFSMSSRLFQERHAAKTVSDIKQFVTKLPHMQAAKNSLATRMCAHCSYGICFICPKLLKIDASVELVCRILNKNNSLQDTAIAELIKEVTDSEFFMGSLTAEQEFISCLDTDKANSYIEDCIAKQEPLIKVLRLICIQCYCNNGFKPKILEYYKREIIQTYGFQHLVSLHNLESVGLLKVQGTTRNYPTIRKTLKLTVEEVNEQNPNDISYVFSGYAPMSVRLAHMMHRPGWRSITEVLSMLPGKTIEEVKQVPPNWMRKRHGSGSSTHSSISDQPKVTLVFFIGGVTYAEISALRFLSQLEDGQTEYVIATTKLINGSSFLQSLMTVLKPKPLNPFGS